MYVFQPTHILIIIIVALILFFPSRLPKVSRGIVSAFSEFRKGMQPEDEKAEDKTGAKTESAKN